MCIRLEFAPNPNPNPNPNPIEVCEHALGTRAALLREADAAQRGGAVARVVAEADEVELGLGLGLG